MEITILDCFSLIHTKILNGCLISTIEHLFITLFTKSSEGQHSGKFLNNSPNLLSKKLSNSLSFLFILQMLLLMYILIESISSNIASSGVVGFNISINTTSSSFIFVVDLETISPSAEVLNIKRINTIVIKIFFIFFHIFEYLTLKNKKGYKIKYLYTEIDFLVLIYIRKIVFMKIICLNCNTDFEVNNNRTNAKFCSRKCKGEYTKKNSGSIRKCIVCNNDFYAKGNPKGRNICSKKCKYEFRKTGKLIKCEKCGTEVYKKLSEINSGKKLFCSVECSNNYQKCEKIKFICKICNNEFEKYPSDIKHSKLRGWEIKYCSIKCRDNDLNRKISKIPKIQHKCKFCDEIFETTKQQKHRKYCSIDCVNKDPNKKDMLIKMNHKQNKNKEPTKLEKRGRELLLNITSDFIEQHLINDKICVDVYIPKSNLIIEWWGDYWHGYNTINPEKRQKRRMDLDISQRKYLEKCGYKVLSFWEHEVYNEPEIVRMEIMNYIL